MRLPLFALAAAVSFAGSPASSHEFWISPQSYAVPVEGQLVADIRVGEKFKGASYAFIPQRFERFDLVMGDRVVPVEGTVGDRPALNMPAPGAGLVTVVHQTGDSILTYSDPDLFENFVTHKDFAWALDVNRERGIPETGFRERYSRYAKSLIAVGAGEGADREVGMETEIVALANPYTGDPAAGMPVRVLYQGQPRVDTQVEVFDRAPDGEVTVTLHRTDGNGEATIPVEAGHEYLFDAVVMRFLEGAGPNDPVWESLWAALTFKVPD